jgi:hypothetical protein
MSTTTIKRKALRNRVKAKQRKSSIKRLTSKPTLKNIDIEEIKATFGTKTTKKEAPKATEAADEKTIKQEKQVVDTKTSPKTEAEVEKTSAEKAEAKAEKAEPKAEKPEAKVEQAEAKAEKAEPKAEKPKEEKSEPAESAEKKSPKATKKPEAKKA